VAFTVILDSCVLYPLPLRDTLLRAAAQDLYVPRWSARILDEVSRNLVEDHRATPAQAARMIAAMGRAFDDAEVPATVIAALETTMNNEPEDRHVLAAAVASHDAHTIATTNLRHFPAEACDPLAIEVIHPDAFLCELFERAPERMHAALADQAAALTRPPMTVSDVLERLHDTIPTFVGRIRDTAAPRGD
jgi:hypothetical protein